MLQIELVATNPFLTTQDVAGRFDVSAATVSRWVREGHLKATRMPGKRSRLRFDPADVDAFAVRYDLDEKASA